MSVDRIKSECTALRRHRKPMRVGICRSADRVSFNSITLQHLGTLTLDEFEQISLDDQLTPSLNESRKSSAIAIKTETKTETKRISHFFSNKKKSAHEPQSKSFIQKRSTSPNRDSGFIETDGTNTSVLTERSVISTSNKRRSKISSEKSEVESIASRKSLESLQRSMTKISNEPADQLNITSGKHSGLSYTNAIVDKRRQSQRDLPTQTVTDACFIYRRQIIKPIEGNDDQSASVVRGREIALEAANAPAIPALMQNYTRDQIRELYGELDRKTRRLQEDEYTLHSPMINAWNEKPSWKLASPSAKSESTDQCPLPGFRLDTSTDNDEALLMSAYLSTGLSNPRTKPIAPVDTIHTVMMNASAKVNEWATNNEIYLTTMDKERIHGSFRTAIGDRSSVSPSPLLLDVQFNLKQLAGTPTGTHDRPTFLEGIAQESPRTTTDSMHHHDEARRPMRRQDNTMDTASSSPDSIEIVFETTPSTPGSCGMYLEPYMRQGYDLPSADNHIRDSSWQYVDNDDCDEATLPLKNISPVPSPRESKIECDTLSSQSATSQFLESNSLVDADEVTTISYHTAKESRIDTSHRSTLSTGSDDTTSTLHQSGARDDLLNNIASPEGSFYFDALASPSNSNQQAVPSIVDKPNVLVDNLANLMEQIETFNQHHRRSLSTIDEEKSRLPAERPDSTHHIDRLITIVHDIHRYNEIHLAETNAMDNLLFIYDFDNQSESPTSSAHADPSTKERDSCVDNLLFVYDENISPFDESPKPIGHDSDEWSYDNLLSDHEQEVRTDNLGTVVHEALAARFQKPIYSKTLETRPDESTLAPPVQQEAEKPSVETDNLGTVIHEALAARFQKPVSIKEKHQEPEPAAVHEHADEASVETDNLGTVIHEALAARFQKPIHVKERHQHQHEPPTAAVEDEVKELPAETDNLGTVIHEALAARFQKPIFAKQADTRHDEPISESAQHEPSAGTDNLGTVVHEALAARFQKPISVKEDRTTVVTSQENIPTLAADIDNLGTLIHDTLVTNFQKLGSTRATDSQHGTVTFQEPPVHTDNLGTVVHEALSARFQSPIYAKPSVELNDASLSDPFDEPVTVIANPLASFDRESFTTDGEPMPETETCETLTYEIEPSNESNEHHSHRDAQFVPVGHLSQIVSDTLLSSSHHHPYPESNAETAASSSFQFNITHQPLFDEEIYEEYGYRRTTTDETTDDIIEKFEELCQRYSSSLDQYQNTAEQIDDEINQVERNYRYHHQSDEQVLSPISETTSEELITTIERISETGDAASRQTNESEDLCSTITVRRQPDHMGKYGFELTDSFDGRIKIGSILDSTLCPSLSADDEILRVNNHRTFQTLEQCQYLFDSLWKNHYETVQITIIRSDNIPIVATPEPVSLQSSSLSWPLSIVEPDFIVDTINNNNNRTMQGFDDEYTKTGASSYSSYKSQITPRSTNVQRRSGAPSGIMTRMYQSYSTSGGSGGFNAGGMGAGMSGLASIAGLGNFAGIPLRPNRGTSALVAVNETREREKRELCQLNDKFAQYVEKVRFLEAQNRKLQLELEALQNKAGQGSSKIKEMYEVEMNEAKKLIDDTTRDRAAAEVKAREAEKEAGRYRKRYDEILNSRETDRSAIDRLQQQIAENEAQINLFRRRLGDLEDEARRYKAETQRLASEIARLQNEIQNETFVKSSLDTEKMALEDELAMLKQMHEADLNELRSKTVVDVNLDPSHFFRNELAQAIRDIRNEFEALNDQQRADLHNRYMMSYNELILRHQKPDLDPIQSEQQRVQEEKLRTTLLTTRNEVAHMKARNEELNNRIRELQLHIDQERDEGGRVIQKRAAEIEELRRKLEQLQKEYEEVTNMKTSLEKEINTYRELLEGTNNREGLKQIVDHVVEEARRMEAERAAGGGGTSGSISYSGGGGGRSTTISRTFISSSGTGSSNAGISGLVSGGGRSGGGFSSTQGGGGSSYGHTSSRREYTSSS